MWAGNSKELMSGILTYLVRRAWQSLFVLLGLTTIVFFLLRLSGDPIRLLAPVDTTAQELETLRRAYGLDRPLVEQYLQFLFRAIQGDFGTSIRNGQPVLDLVLERLPATGKLALTAFAIAMIVAFPLGILAAVKRNTWVDRVLMSLALLGQSMPVFWLGVLLILVFAVNLQVLPATGTRDGWRSLILPAITLGMFSMARTARLLRTELVETLGTDYIRTGRAKGLSESAVVWRHAVRNALIPTVTLIALDLGALLAGSVITETIFAWPGVGRLAVDAIYGRDYPVVQGVVILMAVLYVVVNLLVDLLYTVLNPRVQLK